MKKPIFAANWKMNHGPDAAREFMRTFLGAYPRDDQRTVIIFPSAIAAAAVAESLSGRPDVLLGVQNIHTADSGAFTGETSAGMAREAGARVVLVGHSERRHVFGERDDDCADKVAAAARAGLLPLLCIGEQLDQREGGVAADVVLGQLRAGVAQLEGPARSKLAIAYEPVWAIGTGRNATPADATAIHAVIRNELGSLIGEHAARVPVLYGGSVNKSNARALLDAEGVDGLLVGGASLEAAAWAAIARSVEHG